MWIADKTLPHTYGHGTTCVGGKYEAGLENLAYGASFL